MQLTDLDTRVIQDAIEEFHLQVSTYMDRLATTVANQRYSLPRIHRKRGYAEYPYFYAVDLAELFDFARGLIQMTAQEVNSRCDTIMRTLFSSVSGQVATPDWSAFSDTPLGLCILACGARLQLRHEALITAQHILLLASWSEKHLYRAELTPSDVSSSEPLFDTQMVRSTFTRLGIAV